MLNKKRRRILIFATTISILSSSIGYSLYREMANDYESYIVSFAEELKNDDFLVSAHRGFSSLEVENTKKAISLAAEKQYVDFIEIDARMTQDNKIVLSHNNSLFILGSERNSRVSDLSFDDALNTEFTYNSFTWPNLFCFNPEGIMQNERSLKLNSQSYHLASLLDGLKCCGDKKVLLDLKFNGDTVLFCQELKKELRNVDTSNIIFQSLDIPSLKYLQDTSDFTCQALLKSSRDLIYLDDFERLGFKYDLLDYELIKELIEKGKKISVWTIDSTTTLNLVANILGEYYKDVIYITDYPDLIITKLCEKEQEKVLTKCLG